MKFELKAPCGGCPFRKDKEAVRFLRRERCEGIRESLVEGGGHFACHRTVEYGDEDGEGRYTDRTQHCAGVLILMDHEGQLGQNQLFRIAGRFGMFDPDELDMEAPVFESWDDWVEAQQNG